MTKIRTRSARRNIDNRQLDLFDLHLRERWNGLPWQARLIGRKYSLAAYHAAVICRLAGIGPREDR